MHVQGLSNVRFSSAGQERRRLWGLRLALREQQARLESGNSEPPKGIRGLNRRFPKTSLFFGLALAASCATFSIREAPAQRKIAEQAGVRAGYTGITPQERGVAKTTARTARTLETFWATGFYIATGLGLFGAAKTADQLLPKPPKPEMPQS